jgi:hypothetical protein
MTLKRKDYKCFSPPLFCCWIRDPHLGSDIRDPGSEIRDLDGKFRNRRSGIIIQDPQHCLKTDLLQSKSMSISGQGKLVVSFTNRT